MTKPREPDTRTALLTILILAGVTATAVPVSASHICDGGPSKAEATQLTPACRATVRRNSVEYLHYDQIGPCYDIGLSGYCDTDDTEVRIVACASGGSSWWDESDFPDLVDMQIQFVRTDQRPGDDTGLLPARGWQGSEVIPWTSEWSGPCRRTIFNGDILDETLGGRFYIRLIGGPDVPAGGIDLTMDINVDRA